MEIKDLMKPKKLVLSALVLLSLISIAQENESFESDLDKEVSEVTQQADDVPAFGNESVGLSENKSAAPSAESTNQSESATQNTELDSQMADVESSLNTQDQSSEEMLATTENEGYIIDETQPSGEVAVEKIKDLNAPYKERRSKHGVLFSVFSEKFYPYEYVSLFDDYSALEDINGATDINMMGLELGYKFNFALGSLSALFNFASGETSGTIAPGGTADVRDIKFTRYGGSINYTADNIFNEPYLAPYGQVGIHQFSVEETSSNPANGSDSITTDFSFNYKVGMLFQLNWIEKSIDPSTHIDGLRSSGLENTYLDVYMAWHMPSQNLFDPANPAGTLEGDPDLTSESMLGLGLKMEF